MLGNQNLATVVQMSTLGGSFSWKNMAAQVSYMNKTNRWNWGLVGGQVPYMTGGVRASTTNIGGVPAYVEETVIFRQTDLSAAGVVAYPFNRARRLEFQGGMSQISFDEVTYTEAYDLRNGGLIFRDTQEQSVAESLTMGTTVGGAGLRHVDLRRHESGAAASGIAWKRRRRLATSATPACSPTTAATSCRRPSTRSRRV